MQVRVLAFYVYPRIFSFPLPFVAVDSAPLDLLSSRRASRGPQTQAEAAEKLRNLEVVGLEASARDASPMSQADKLRIRRPIRQFARTAVKGAANGRQKLN